MAAATISMVPTVILVLALQKYLVKGIALSGLGGRGDDACWACSTPEVLGRLPSATEGCRPEYPHQCVTDDAITRNPTDDLDRELAPGDRLPPEGNLAANLGLS